MKPERWPRIREIFEGALEVPPNRRAGWLADACGNDPALRADVEALLAAEAEAGAWLEAPLHAFAGGLLVEVAGESARPAHGSRAERRIGPYRLVREIGRGGMGTVYLAERADGQFDQRVAVKLLPHDPRAGDVFRRFLAERQILASLNHPNIARLLDGGFAEPAPGAAGSGQPYFVMEYVQGDALDTYCDGRRLRIDERLALFITVCRAVEYAHRNLVVHRDLKPSNILVAEDGTIKLVDFGIAKLLDPAVTAPRVPETRTGHRWMTPEYAAPEQISGGPVTTATDIYQLGVLLYELLSGRRPFERDGRNPREVEQAVLDREPEKPSTASGRVTAQAARAEATGGHAAAASRARSTQPERLRRMLRGDLDAIVMKALRKEPDARYASVDALVGDLTRHRAGRPVRARRGTAGYRTRKFLRRHRWGVGVTAASIAAVAGLGTLYSVQVTHERDRARLEAEKSDQVTGFLMGLFEANDPREAGGDSITARVLLERGLQQAEALGQQPLVQAQMLDVLGRVYRSLGQYDVARPLLERALASRRSLLGDDHPDVARTLNGLASVLKDMGDYEAAEPLLRESLRMRRELLGEEDLDVAESLNSLGSLLHDRGEYEAAERLYRDALAIRRKLNGEKHADVATTMNNLGLLLMRKGDYEGAEALHREALAMRRELLGDRHLDVTYSLNNLALVLHYRGDYEEAEPLYRELVDLDRELLGEQHPEYALDLNNLGGLLKDRGDLEGAEALYRESLAIQKKAFGNSHPRVAQVLNNLGGLLLRRGDYDGAERLYREALAIRKELLGDGHPDVATTMNNLAAPLRARGDLAGAESLIREALAIRQASLGDEHPDVARSLHDLASLRVLRGDLEQAETLFREAVRIDATVLGDANWLTAHHRSGLAALLTGRARYEEAEPLLLEAHAVLSSERGNGHRFTRQVRERLVALYEAWGRSDEAARYRDLDTPSIP